MKRSNKEWKEVFIKEGAFWLHSSDIKDPHARLTTGNHSDGFINSKLMLELERYGFDLCGDVLYMLRQHGLSYEIDHVVGPASGATKMAEMMAQQITLHRNNGVECPWSSPKKIGEGDSKKLVFEACRPNPGDNVLIVEDTMTTGSSALLAIEAVENCEANVMPFMGVAANRSGTTHVDGKRIVSLLNESMDIWTPEKCPLCDGGSTAMRPKQGTNWETYFQTAS